MTDNRSLLQTSHQGHLTDEKSFAIVGVVKDDMTSQFSSKVGIQNANQKCFLVCGCTVKDTDDIILYLSNDPIDFVYNNTSLINNHGVIPFRKNGNFLTLDINSNHNSQTVYLPREQPFTLSDRTELNSIEFSFVESGNLTEQAHFGVPLTLNHTGSNRINFYVRKNVLEIDSGRIGPSICVFESSIFEYLRTISYAREGTDFTYNSDTKLFGMSKLVDDTPTKSFTILGSTTNTGIVEIKQNNNTSYNLFHNPSGVSDIYFNYESGYSFLNKTTFNPDTSNGGISVQINIRNSLENFLSINAITNTSNEVFDYYLINLSDFTCGGLINDSSQYIEDNGDISGGLSYYFDSQYYNYETLFNENMKGLIHGLNLINNTSKNITNTDNALLSTLHASATTVFSNYYDSTKCLNMNSLITYGNDSDSEKNKNLESSNGNVLTHNSTAKNIYEKDGNIFTTNPKKGQNAFLIEIISMSIILFIFIILSVTFFYL